MNIHFTIHKLLTLSHKLDDFYFYGLEEKESREDELFMKNFSNKNYTNS